MEPIRVVYEMPLFCRNKMVETFKVKQKSQITV